MMDLGNVLWMILLLLDQIREMPLKLTDQNWLQWNACTFDNDAPYIILKYILQHSQFLQLGLACMASDCESSFPVSKFLFASSTWTFKCVILHHLDCSHLLHLTLGFYFSKMLKLETLRISFYLILWVEVKRIASVYVWVDRSCGIF